MSPKAFIMLEGTSAIQERYSHCNNIDFGDGCGEYSSYPISGRILRARLMLDGLYNRGGIGN